MDGLGVLLQRISGTNSFLQLFGLVLFAALIPLFSLVSVAGIRRTARIRRTGLIAVFAELEKTIHFLYYNASESRGVGQVKLARYIVPICFIFALNIFMSITLLDFMGMTNNLIASNARVFILCGGHCTDLTDRELINYQTQTFVAASYAFLGWMVWTFSTIFDRAGALQLFPSTFNRLLIRLVIAILVAIVVRHLLGVNDSATLASAPVYFAIGMFPETGLNMIAGKFKEWTRSAVHSEDFNLELIEGVSPSISYRLEEIGIDNGAALAFANPFAIFDASLTPMDEILDWIAQAQLLVFLKAGRFQALQKAGYRTIFDLIRLMKGPNGAATLRTLCNWDVPQGYDPVAAIEAGSQFKRLREMYAAIGGNLP